MVEVRKERHISQEEALAKSLLKISEVDPKDIPKIISEVDDPEIFSLSALYTLGEELGIDALKEFCDNFLLLRISKHRLGRREIAITVGLASAGGGGGWRPKSIRDLFSGLRL